MALPYQCLRACTPNPQNGGNWILLGASGSNIVSQSASGSTSIWEAKRENLSDDHQEDEPQEPPGKKIKLAQAANKAPNLTSMIVSDDGQYLVAVTAEDKCVRVFHVNTNSQLQQLSQRCMPKRPCAVTLASGDSTILCADKFGDVYALPLLLSPDEDQGAKVIDIPQKPYVPAATTLTVHSGRNRRVLEDQLREANRQTPKQKEPLRFKHDLLLGHVSMLTDIAYTTVNAEGEGGKPRSYILTADRDEHIRISRAPPQAHIIEGFCQGHEEFVSRLCLTKTGPLVSGGGDAQLLFWDWIRFRLLESISIKEPVLEYFKGDRERLPTLERVGDDINVAVSGIWAIGEKPKEDILVACEGVPALFRFRLTGSAPIATLVQTLALNGNVLDVAFIFGEGEVNVGVISIDNLHKLGSTTERRHEEDCPSRVQAFSIQEDGAWVGDAKFDQQLQWFNSRGVDDASQIGEESEDSKFTEQKAVRDILYGVEKLRKRGGAEE